MDCYLRRLKQELVRAEQERGTGRTAPPRPRYLAWAPRSLHRADAERKGERMPTGR